jgi:hypothetical protein
MARPRVREFSKQKRPVLEPENSVDVNPMTIWLLHVVSIGYQLSDRLAGVKKALLRKLVTFEENTMQTARHKRDTYASACPTRLVRPCCRQMGGPDLGTITPLGKTLSATVDGLRVWAETHIDKVLKAQRQSDASLHRTAA